MQHMRGELQAAESENNSLSEELSRTRAKGHQAAGEVDRLQKRVDDLQHFSNVERQVSSQHYASPSDRKSGAWEQHCNLT